MGLKHELTKLRMMWTHFMGRKKGGAKCKHFIVLTIKIYQEKVVGLKKIQSWYHHILYLKSTNCCMMKFFNFLISTMFSVRLHGRNACYVIFWNIAPKHWIYMDRGYCNSFYFYLFHKAFKALIILKKK
jgi:hypothetical protein